jgi:hypothetical protein
VRRILKYCQVESNKETNQKYRIHTAQIIPNGTVFASSARLALLRHILTTVWCLADVTVWFEVKPEHVIKFRNAEPNTNLSLWRHAFMRSKKVFKS